MKKFKKITALVLALAMVLAMSLTSFAAEGSHKITIGGAKNANDTFKAYQIFSGKENEGVLTDVEWGDGVHGATLLAELVKLDTFKGAESAADIADKLEAGKDTQQAKDFAALAAKYVTATSGTFANGEITGLADGYYLVQSDNTDEKSAQTRFILTVVKDASVEVKTEVPKMEKKLKEKDDTAGTETDWQDASDYDIGDDVPYQISTKVVSNYGEYVKYFLAFNDTMDPGLTYNEDAVVNLNDNSIDSSLYTVTKTANGFRIEIADLKLTDAKAGDTITVNYSGTLNESAKIGDEGNKNTANMEFSNNPNTDGKGTPETGKTPDDTVITFTYKTVVNKVDKDGNELPNAGFTLYKKVEGYTGTADEVEKAGAGYKTVKAYEAGEATTFDFVGLDAGSYKLVETETPANYNSIDPITFTVTSKFGTEDEADNLELLDLSVDNTEFTIEKKTGKVEGTEVPTGTITTDVTNYSGAELPSTGGMGTTMIYIIGAILAIGAGVLLITKKRVQR